MTTRGNPRAISALAVAVAAVGFATAPSARAATLELTPVADASFAESHPRRNYGVRRSLFVGGRVAGTAFLRFSVPALDGRIVRARLRLYPVAGSSRIAVRIGRGWWSESSITAARARRPGRAIALSGRLRARRTVTFDVTRAVTRSGPVSLALVRLGRRQISFASREAAAALRPRLIVETSTESGAAAPAASSPAAPPAAPTAAAPPPSTGDSAPPPPTPTATLVGAGDIAVCGREGDEATAALLDGLPGTVFTAGDNVYENGTAAEFASCYEPSWGRHKARTRPALGNHEYGTAGAAGYFGYFGAAAGESDKGYYSYDAGSWHVVVLNTEIPHHAGSAQEAWLRQDLAAHPTSCSLAILHRPRFSSTNRAVSSVQPLWQALYDAGAEVVVSGDAHNYERFAPQTPGGSRDEARGIRQFVVGTGGAVPAGFGSTASHSEVRESGTYGVIELTLAAGSYSWRFVPTSGSFTDSGSTGCH